MVEAQGRVTHNDAGTRILRLPRAIRVAIPEGITAIDVTVVGESTPQRLTIAASRAFLGGVTDLFRRSGLLRAGELGAETREAEVDWALDTAELLMTIEIRPKGSWAASASAKGGDPGGLANTIKAANARVPKPRVQVRASAATEARTLITNNLGQLTGEQLRELLRLFNVDSVDGNPRADRFSPGFIGATAHKLVDALDRVNAWLARIWAADGDELDAALTDAFATKPFPSARSMLTMALHVREPERFSPVLGSLERSYRALTGDTAVKTGADYRRYNAYLTGLNSSHGLSPHAVDVFLMTAAKQAKHEELEDQQVVEQEDFGGFSLESFSFLAELTANNNDEWFIPQHKRFGMKVREPLRELISTLGERFVEAVCPELERTPKIPQTLANIRKNSFGLTTNNFWPYYWAAFHRRDRKKTEDFQLYVTLHADRLEFGMSTLSASDADIEIFVRRLQSLGQAKRALAEAREHGCAFGGATDHEPLEIHDVASLVSALESRAVTIWRQLPPTEVVELGPELATRVEQTFRALYPLYAIATASDPEATLRSYWDEPLVEVEPDEPTYTLEQLRRETLLGQDHVDELVELLLHKRQVVLYGPPGTGKTWLAERFAKYFVRDGGECRVVQFHPSYGYEDFIEGIRPTVDPVTRQPYYEVKPGAFKRICEEARKYRHQRFVLIIDEINRGNLPRIFGELLYLLERRGDEIELAVSGKPFSVPTNIYILGTMNTADHSIALVDVALRRRFHFKSLQADVPLLRAWLAREVPAMVGAADLLDKLNTELANEGIDENLRIGHSHFMVHGLDEDVLRRIWQHSIIPTLEEYFYGKPKKLARFRWEAFIDADLFELDEPEHDDSDDEVNA
jgi:uncharacterized protein (DUF2461 family)